jgi:hypothetical protein
MDGLDLCRNVYDVFDQVRNGVDGIERLRLRPTKLEKRLLEELIPIARYVQARYREGRRIKVRWLSGSQPFDAILWSSGAFVDHRMAPRRLLVEVTTAVHPKDYLLRRLAHEGRPSFGVKGIWVDNKTRAIVSKAHVNKNDEIAVDLADQIMECLRKKVGKRYPLGTALIVNCVTSSIIVDSEWQDAMARVRQSGLYSTFREVFVLDALSMNFTTLYGQPKRRR